MIGDDLTGDTGDNVLDGLAGSNTLQGDPENATTTGNDTFVIWKRDRGADTISDFEVRGADGQVRDVIHLRGFSANSIATLADTGSVINVSTDGETAIQNIITLTGVDRGVLGVMIGANGRGDSELMIFVD